MVKTWLVQLVVQYVLAQLEKFTTGVDWAAVLAEAEGYVAKFVPSFLVATVDGVVVGAVAAVQAALADSADLELILKDLANGLWSDALATLETLLGKVVHPAQPAVLAAVQAMRVA